MRFLLPRYVDDNPPVMHHNQAVAITDGVPHIVRDHHGGQAALVDNLLGKLQHLSGGFRVQRSGMLVQQEELWLLQRGHEQRQGLALSAGQELDLGGQPVLQPEAQPRQLLPVLRALCAADAPAEPAPLAAPVRQSQILLNPHIARRPHHGILKHAAQELCPPVLRHGRNLLSIDKNLTRGGRISAGNTVEQRGLARAVAADHRDKIPLGKMEVHAVERHLFIDRTAVEYDPHVFHFEHARSPSLASFLACILCRNTGSASAMATVMAVNSFRSLAGMPSFSTSAMMMR